MGLPSRFALVACALGATVTMCAASDPTQAEDTLLVVHHGERRLRLYEQGVLTGEWEIALGQAEGAKEVRGDLKTPVGTYFVVAKSTGPFSGTYSEYFGGHWIKINYPNAADAERG